MTIALIILGVLLVISLVGGWLMSNVIIHPDVADYDECYEDEIVLGGLKREEFENDFEKEELYIDSPCGYKLHTMVIAPAPGTGDFLDGKKRVAVIAHGYTYTLFGSVKYAGIFRKLGFYSVIYDERNHGKTGRAPTTMGWYECYDLAAMCSWARERFGEDCVLGTHGESMGAATVMLHAPTDPKLAFAIEDSGYSDLSRQLAFAMKTTYHLPRYPFLTLASFFSVLRGGIRFSRVHPVSAVAHCPEELPMLFIHGTGDDLVQVSMAQENFSAKKGKKRLQLFDQLGHAQSWFSHPEEYAELIESFLRENNII